MTPSDHPSQALAASAGDTIAPSHAVTRTSSSASARVASVAISHSRWFYSLASLALLVLTIIGFQFFYMKGQAYPGRPLTPPIRTLVITHGVLMSVWMLLAVIQPLLVGMKFKRLHMKLGILGILLTIGMIAVGWMVGIAATRVNPPEMMLFGLNGHQFMAVPLIGILVFALFVLIGVMNRRRPDIHRPMMFMATLSVVAAALGRIPQISAWSFGTWWEQTFSAFVMTVVIGAILLVGKCIVTRSFDRWFAIAFALLTAASVGITFFAKTAAWNHIALYLLR